MRVHAGVSSSTVVRTSSRNGTRMQGGNWSLLGPEQWFLFIHRHVKVRLKAGKLPEVCGWLTNVDPVTASLVLVTLTEDSGSVRVVMGHAVQDVEVLGNADPETEERLQSTFAASTAPSPDPKELTRRKERVRSWLQENRVPVEEGGRRRPHHWGSYGPEDCRCANQIILDRIQRLIRVTGTHKPV
ncbi:gem-associated protein 6-like [Pholidichthys leucotaenia]